MVITGYFAQAKKYKEKNLELVSVSPVKPEWFTDPSVKDYPALFPTREMLFNFQESNNIQVFVDAYNSEILSKLDPSKVYYDLNNKVILCYERPTDFSHRHLIAYWLIQNGFQAKEFNVSNEMYQRTWLIS